MMDKVDKWDKIEHDTFYRCIIMQTLDELNEDGRKEKREQIDPSDRFDPSKLLMKFKTKQNPLDYFEIKRNLNAWAEGERLQQKL